MRYKNQFKVDNILYELTVSDGYSLNIALIGGHTKDGKAIFFDEDSFIDCNASKYGINNIVKNPKKVLREFTKQVQNYLYENRPPILRFTAIEENRQRVYSKYLIKYLPEQYNLYSDNEGSFLMVLQ